MFHVKPGFGDHTELGPLAVVVPELEFELDEELELEAGLELVLLEWIPLPYLLFWLTL